MRIKIRIQIKGKDKKKVYQYPSLRKFDFFANNKAKQRSIFDAGKTITVSVWYLQSTPIDMKLPDNEMECKSLEDIQFVFQGFMREYL